MWKKGCDFYEHIQRALPPQIHRRLGTGQPRRKAFCCCLFCKHFPFLKTFSLPSPGREGTGDVLPAGQLGRPSDNTHDWEQEEGVRHEPPASSLQPPGAFVGNGQPQKRNFNHSQGNPLFALQASGEGWAWQQRGVS